MEPKNTLPKQLTKVTPFSKTLAAIIFITLPFVGLYIGYIYAPEKVVQVTVTPETQQVVELERLGGGTVVNEDVEPVTSVERQYSYAEIKADDEVEFTVNDNIYYAAIIESSDMQTDFVQYDFNMYKKVAGEDGTVSYEYVLGAKDLPQGMNMFKPTWLSESEEVLAISLLGCWRCGGTLYPPVVVVDLQSNTQPLQTIEIGEVVDFEWVDDRSFRYKSLPGSEQITDASLCGMGGCLIEAYDLASVPWQSGSI